MSIDPLDRPHDQQPVPGQDQNPSHPASNGAKPAGPAEPETGKAPNEPGQGNPLP